MKAVLGEALKKAYLPGGAGHGHHGHDGAHGPGDDRRDAHHHAQGAPLHTPLTSAGTPATPVDSGDPEALVARFCEELEALAGATYRVRDVHDAADQVAAILKRTGTSVVLSWAFDEIGVPGLAAALSVRGVTVAPPEVPFSDPERAGRLVPMAELAVGLTGAQAAIAESGSLVLASGPGRGRLASLLTPLHIAILRRDRIVRSLSDLFERHPELPTLGSNMVIITGPSRTADIEMTLSRGVHGPREIHVIVV